MRKNLFVSIPLMLHSLAASWLIAGLKLKWFVNLELTVWFYLFSVDLFGASPYTANNNKFLSIDLPEVLNFPVGLPK